MRRALAAMATIGTVLAVSACGRAQSSQPTMTATVTAPARSTAAPTQTAVSSQPIGAGTGVTSTVRAAPVAKFGDTVDLKDSQIKVTMGVPTIWNGDGTNKANPIGYAEGAKTVVHIKLTVHNYGSFNFNPSYLKFTETIAGSSAWVLNADDDQVPTTVSPGETDSWILETGGDAKGRLSVEVNVSSKSDLATFSNEPQR